MAFFHAKNDLYSLKQPDNRISQDGVHDLAIMFGLRIISALAVAVMTAVNSRLDSTSETHGGIAHHHQCDKVTNLQTFFVVVKLSLKTLNRHLAHTHKTTPHRKTVHPRVAVRTNRCCQSWMTMPWMRTPVVIRSLNQWMATTYCAWRKKLWCGASAFCAIRFGLGLKGWG